MTIERNPFKQALLARRLQIGLVLGLGDAYCADLVGGADFDWLLIDGEHSPTDPRHVLAQLQVLAVHRAEPAFRPSGGEAPSAMTRWLDLGVRTLVVPMVDSARQAAEWVAATRYPPTGRRGVGSALSRAAAWGRDDRHLAEADDAICVIAQIETPAGVEAAEAIARVDGIDGVLIGPSDLAATSGHRGAPDHPEVRSAITTVITRTLAAGKAAGLFVGDPEAAARYAALGCTFLIVGTDTRVLARALDDTAGRFRAALGAAARDTSGPRTVTGSPATR
ncbi:MAG: aldolase/citrate lyase family protein [Lautropia sp.]